MDDTFDNSFFMLLIRKDLSISKWTLKHNQRTAKGVITLFEMGQQTTKLNRSIDPLQVRGNAANLEDRTIRFFLHENRSQFPEEKIYFVLSSRLAAFPWCARGLTESEDGEVRNFIQSHTIKNYYQMTNLVLNFFWIFFLVKKCHNCSPQATCINKECVCKPGFIGNGKHCQRKYSYRKNQTAITSCPTLTPTQNSNN